MSDSDDFPKLRDDDETSSNDSEDSTEGNDSENSEICDDQISASALVSALKDAGQKVSQFENVNESDRLNDKFLIESFYQVSF